MTPTPLDLAQAHARAADPDEFDDEPGGAEHADEQPERTWLVLAAQCPHGITITAIDCPKPGAEQNDNPNEFAATGPDWRPLATTAALNLHHTTGKPICAECVGAYAMYGYPGHLRTDLTTAATLLGRYAELADILGIPTNNTTS